MFKDDEVACLMRHLLEGLKYLHSLNIIHRDLKPGKYLNNKIENVLLGKEGDLHTVKIVDFGLSAKMELRSYANAKTQCGTLLYMAPEIFTRPSYTKSVDVWACAVIMYLMINNGNHPIYHVGMKTE